MTKPNMTPTLKLLWLSAMLLASGCSTLSVPVPNDCPVFPSPPKELQSSASTVQDLSPRFELLLEEFRTSLLKEMKP
jgi:hypothetical protein